MESWLKLRAELFSSPDVARMGALLGLGRFDIVGRLAAVWGWAEGFPDGVADGIGSADIDAVAEQAGFAGAMLAVGWLAATETGVAFPEWDRHISPAAKSRAGERIRRSATRRKRGECPAQAPDKPHQQKTAENQHTGECPARPSDQRFPEGIHQSGGPAGAGPAARRQQSVGVPPGAVEAVRSARVDWSRSVFRKLTGDRIRDPATIAAWLRWAVQQDECPRLRHLDGSTACLARVLAAADHATRSGRDPARLFSAIVGRGDFSRLPPAAMARGRDLADYYAATSAQRAG